MVNKKDDKTVNTTDVSAEKQLSPMDLILRETEEYNKKNSKTTNEDDEKKKARLQKFANFPLIDNAKTTLKVRFITPSDKSKLLYYSYHRHQITIGKKTYLYFCPRNEGLTCPICQAHVNDKGVKTESLVQKFYREDPEFYRTIKVKKSWVWIQFIRVAYVEMNDKKAKLSDNQKKEFEVAEKQCEEMVKKWKYVVISEEQHEYVKSKMFDNPKLGEKGILIFDLIKGADFVVTAYKKQIENKYKPNTTLSVFGSDYDCKNPSSLDENEIKFIESEEIIDPKTFIEEQKVIYGYDELKEIVLNHYTEWKEFKNNKTPSADTSDETPDEKDGDIEFTPSSNKSINNL